MMGNTSDYELATPLFHNELYPNLFTAIMVGLSFSLLTIWTIFGNLLVLISLARYNRLRSTSNLLIGNLATSDFLLALTVLPLSAINDLIGYWPFGLIMCNIWLLIDVFYCTASVWGLVAIAFDRYTATNFPVWYRNHGSGCQRAFPYIIFVWIFSCLICVPPLIGWDGKNFSNPQFKFHQHYLSINSSGKHECVPFSEMHYVIYSSMGSFIIPMGVMIILYTKIFCLMQTRAKLWRKNFSVTSQHSTMLASVRSTRAGTKAVEDTDNGNHEVNVKVDVNPVERMEDNRLNHMEARVKLLNDDEPGESAPETKSDSIKVVSIEVEKVSKTSNFLNYNNDCNQITEEKAGSHAGLRSKMRRPTLIPRKWRRHGVSPIDSGIARADARERRATKRMALIIGVFTICWIPFTFMYLIRSFCQTNECIDHWPELQHAQMFVTWLGYANSGLNPILYTLCNEDFRRAFIILLFGRQTTLLRRLTGQSLSSSIR